MVGSRPDETRTPPPSRTPGVQCSFPRLAASIAEFRSDEAVQHSCKHRLGLSLTRLAIHVGRGGIEGDDGVEVPLLPDFRSTFACDQTVLAAAP
jgi:hypothetical protein